MTSLFFQTILRKRKSLLLGRGAVSQTLARRSGLLFVDPGGIRLLHEADAVLKTAFGWREE